MNKLTNTKNINNFSSEGFEWKQVQNEMKNKLSLEVYESWLKKISFVEEFNNWQFYIHHNQEDNLLAISGGRTFFLVNFGWDYPFYKVRLESCGYILRIPRGTFHRSVSDENGSIVLNQAIRDEGGTVESEFKVTNSKDNKKLLDCITNLEPRFKIYSVK